MQNGLVNNVRETCLRVAQQEHLLLEDGVAVLLEEADGRVLDVVGEVVHNERRVGEARLGEARVRVALDEVRVELAAPVLVRALSELHVIYMRLPIRASAL